MKILTDKTYRGYRTIVCAVGPKGISTDWLDRIAQCNGKLEISAGKQTSRLFARIRLKV